VAVVGHEEWKGAIGEAGRDAMSIGWLGGNKMSEREGGTIRRQHLCTLNLALSGL